MATTTTTINDTAYTLISANGIIATANAGRSISFAAGDSTPSVDTKGHTVADGESRVFPKPSSGSWYATTSGGTGSVVFTEI